MTQDSLETPKMGDSSERREMKSSDSRREIGGGECNANDNVYKAQEFRDAFVERIGKNSFPRCPFCGGNQFEIFDKYSSLLVGETFAGLNLGPTVPTGIIVCRNCGHIEMFALGILGLLPKNKRKIDDV